MMHPDAAVTRRPTWPLISRTRGAARIRRGQRLAVFGVIAAIVVLDQSVKWWAWRNVSGVRVNYGGDALAIDGIGKLYRGPVAGALLDLFDSALILAAGWLLLRRRRSIAVMISGALVIGGWGSDILDRLGMHYWTAPGSVRGVVDFIPIGPHYYNIADLFIIAGTPLFVLAATGSLVRRFVVARPAAAAAADGHAARRSSGVRRFASTAVAAATLVAATGIGAATFGGVNAPLPSTSATVQPVLITHQGTLVDIS
jgi:lipoprotein signal peptidase